MRPVFGKWQTVFNTGRLRWDAILILDIGPGECIGNILKHEDTIHSRVGRLRRRVMDVRVYSGRVN